MSHNSLCPTQYLTYIGMRHATAQMPLHKSYRHRNYMWETEIILSFYLTMSLRNHRFTTT